MVTVMSVVFVQSAPKLGNQYRDDAFLRGYLARALPVKVLRDIEPELMSMGELAATRISG